MKKLKSSRSFLAAIQRAQVLAKEGPRVSAVLVTRNPRLKYTAAPGFIDRDENGVEQIRLITPDGRVWVCQD